MNGNCNPFGNACEEYSGQQATVLTAKDRRSVSEYRIENKSKHYLVKIKVDGCLIEEKAGVRKCDYLILDCTAKRAFFIELKGQSLKDALVQIKDTLVQLGSHLDEFSFHCRIVQSKVIRATQQQHKADLIQFLKTGFPKNTKEIRFLVRIESQKLIELI